MLRFRASFPTLGHSQKCSKKTRTGRRDRLVRTSTRMAECKQQEHVHPVYATTQRNNTMRSCFEGKSAGMVQHRRAPGSWCVSNVAGSMCMYVQTPLTRPTETCTQHLRNGIRNLCPAPFMGVVHATRRAEMAGTNKPKLVELQDESPTDRPNWAQHWSSGTSQSVETYRHENRMLYKLGLAYVPSAKAQVELTRKHGTSIRSRCCPRHRSLTSRSNRAPVHQACCEKKL